ncbi:hypothetical protein Sjap_017404 [Stephania japonica]|uniref:DYW domain-containing protein n=1 Tax=Stephania japonica TaxID=461633 RepID=A0AAP0NJW2_9MAGN
MATTHLSWTLHRPSHSHPSDRRPQRIPRRQRSPITRAVSRPLTPTDLSMTRTLCAHIDSGRLDDALQVFDKMSQPDTFAWNVIIRGLTNAGLYDEAIEFYHQMECLGVRADNFTYPLVIKCCAESGAMLEGLRVHSKAIKTRLISDVYACNALIAMYGKLGSVGCAEKVFDEMPVRDLVSWNSMISVFVSVGDGRRSLLWFREMWAERGETDRLGIVGALAGCSLVNCGKLGKEIHCHVIRFGFESDVMVQTSLINMYGKCRNVGFAERLFNGMFGRSVAAWNAMIGGYVLNEKTVEAFHCWRKMQEVDNLDPVVVTMVNLVPACSQLKDLLLGKSIHGAAIRKGFLPHMILETALVDMYGKCGKWELAESIFGQMVDRSVTTWNAMLAAYVQNGCHWKALNMFRDLFYQSLRPDAFTISIILPSYAEVASLREGRQVQSYIIKSDIGFNTCISNAIVYMYATCGDIKTARRIFDAMKLKDVVSWNTIIMGYAIHGCGRIAVDLFVAMQEEGIKPNASTFFSLLSSCSISGMIEEGWRYFNSMKQEYGIDPGIEHYSCMVDLLGRTGNLYLVKNFIWKMPLVPTAKIWGSLLRASRNNGNIEFAELAAEQIFSLGHDNTGCYVLLSNMYAELGRWDDVERIRCQMQNEGLTKAFKQSRVELSSRTCSFVNGDTSYIETPMIYDALDIIYAQIGESIYNPSASKFIPIDVLKKRASLPSTHSVRLALCLGLISSSVGTPIHIRKNARICESCHHVLKKTSLVTKREIIIGDSKIFHHFKDGKCCCGDYW